MSVIPNTISIVTYMHCGKCMDERPTGTSPRDYARLNVGWTKLGLQIWCVRHDCNVAHLDLQGNKVGINTTIPRKRTKRT